MLTGGWSAADGISDTLTAMLLFACLALRLSQSRGHRRSQKLLV